MTNTKKIFFHLRAGIGLLLIFTVLLGGVYPLVVTAISQVFFHDKTAGSLISKDGKVIGSELLGQRFTENKYFWGRLSANNYDAMNSGGTNYSPANSKLLEAANARIAELQKSDPKNKAKIPVELITASASGLDPHISLAAAEYQVGRVAKARNMKEEDVKKLIADHIDAQSKIFGNSYANVLEINIALDEMSNKPDLHKNLQSPASPSEQEKKGKRK